MMNTPTEEQLKGIARKVNPLLMMVDMLQLEVIFSPYLNDNQKQKLTRKLEELCIEHEAENLSVVLEDEKEVEEKGQ